MITDLSLRDLVRVDYLAFVGTNKAQVDCLSCAQLRQKLALLREQVAKMTAAIEEAQRRGKRQAAPFSKGPPVAEPKQPGRKSGKRHGPHAQRSVPPRIDETYDAPLLSFGALKQATHRRVVTSLV